MKTIGLAFIFCGFIAVGQESGSFTVPFSDPARPKTLRATLVNACVAVTGYDGREVVVESAPSETRSSRRHGPPGSEGLRKLDLGRADISIEEEANTVRISGTGNGHLRLKVPMDTTVKIDCVNGGDLKVEHLSGNVELSSTNSRVIATGMSGPVIAHSQNGKVTVSLDRVVPDKAMSITSYNGDVDLSLPADAKVTIRMSSNNGDVYTEFDTKLSPSANKVELSNEGGKRKVKMERTTTGTINGGGADMTVKSYNGNIFIRKKQ